MLVKLSWEAVYEGPNVNIAKNYFYAKLCSVFDQCVPLFTISNRKSVNLNKPWFTTELHYYSTNEASRC